MHEDFDSSRVPTPRGQRPVPAGPRRSESRQQVTAYRREAGGARPLSGRQWKRHRRYLRKAGLL